MRNEPPGTLVQINVSPRGGVPKTRVTEAMVLRTGIEGDKQRDRRFHGGPERALCLYSWELIRDLQEEGHPIDAGTTGENLTISGIDWATVRPGVLLQICDVQMEIATYTVPCKNIRYSFNDGEFMRVSQKTNPGWSRVYARVIKEGVIREGDAVVVLETVEHKGTSS